MSPMYLSTPAICDIIIILVSLLSHGVETQTQQDGYRQAVGCFSTKFNNFLELSCSEEDVISVEWVIFGTRPDKTCPTDGSLSEKQAHCCVPRCGDCVVENERESQNVFSCNNKQKCSLWTRTTWVEKCEPMSVTTYMMVLYTCNNTNNTLLDTSIANTSPSFNQIHCGHSGGIPPGTGEITLSPPSPASSPAPPVAGPRTVIGCYSSFHKQKIEIKCQRGEGIAIYGVFFAAKSNDTCPSDGFIITEEQKGCCVPTCEDCVIAQTNEAGYIYQKCTGEKECSPWTHRILINDCGVQEYTSYMVVHYECLRDFSRSLTSDAIGKSFEELYGCPLPLTTESPSTVSAAQNTTLKLSSVKQAVPRTTTKTTRKIQKTTPRAKTTTTTTTARHTTTTTRPAPTAVQNHDGTFVAVGCYSNVYKPKVEITCEPNSHIFIHGVFFGTRQHSTCPPSGLVKEGQEECCKPKCGDCVSYGGHGEVNNLLKNCSYQQKCSVWTQRSLMNDCGNKSFTSYMAVHYQCTKNGMDAIGTVSFDHLFCPPGSGNYSRSTMPPQTLSPSTTLRPTRPTAVIQTSLSRPDPDERTTTGWSPSRAPTRNPTTSRNPQKSTAVGQGTNRIPRVYPGKTAEDETESKKVLVGAVVGGIASVIVIGIAFVVILHLRRSREKTVVTRGPSLDRKRKRKRNHSKNNSQCTNSTHLNSVAAPSNLTMINVISNNGRLPGKGDYNHLERWLGDLETTTDNFDLPRISEVSESDTDADIESRVRRITTLAHRSPDFLQESDS